MKAEEQQRKAEEKGIAAGAAAGGRGNKVPACDSLQLAMSRQQRNDALPPETLKAIQDYWHARSFPTANVRDRIAVR